MSYISIAIRVIANLESLSGVETVGNLSRHRTAPVVIPQSDGYVIRFLPVISGESLAHAYQELLVEEAKIRSLPLGKHSQRCEFLKFCDENILSEEGITPPENEEDIRRAEVDILLKDFVSDVGGFLYAGRKGMPIKRTSCFQVGYAIPAIWEREVAALESQFHVRFSPSKMDLQMPYNVEVGSAIYNFTFNMDLSRIGIPSTQFGKRNEEKEKRLLESRQQRVQASLSALIKFYSYLPFGAKRSRFLPNMEPVSAVAAYSRNARFVVSPGNEKGFIARSEERKTAFINTLKQSVGNLNIEPDVKLFAYDREEATKGVAVTTYPTLEDMLKSMLESLSEEARKNV